MNTLQTTTLTILGAGRVGKTLARALHSQGAVTIADILNRSPSSAQRAAEFIGAGRAVDAFGQLAPATVFLLAVPDDQIAPCSEQLAATGRAGPGSVVFHCSGALDSGILKAVTTTGAVVASIHPIRSFADPQTVAASFAGTCCGVEGDAEAMAILTPMLTQIGARLIPIRAESKTLYHAAAVFASNYLVSVLSVAQQAYVAAGIPADVALALLTPLARETAENAFRLGPATALTGPIARGDTATVARHLQAVQQWDEAYGNLYEQLAAATTRLAASR
ncbi:Rossmann-like and DUF2520 domain-containing protein [Actimicrobium sp. CCI2.3]|uniref:Rossmann-like and DUF2520 domain-containing protein n=1 Tax=Actimicrobium sp. CCI2.3 TaxID=3048616 RepID=UPI002AB3A896|nr:Rossmann-like and DUF2520 domain-containing protein [Actimicrobium sp. CCI2.3]MDY7574548.1 DUF2520 domain-containing protein [Actimicrobium sp. CCI2.3]MEB0020924.1 DUF2520 domain-containing protein [Actimicrobium sp. CCI2.3]